MTTAEKLIKLNEGVEQVAECNEQLTQILAGTDTGAKGYYDYFWDNYQNNGNRTNYDTAFAGEGWSREMFAPKHDIVVESGYMMFKSICANGEAFSLPERLAELGVSLTITGNVQYLFYFANLTEIGAIDCTYPSRPNVITTIRDVFNDCKATKIGPVKFKETDTLSNVFLKCANLVDLSIDGVIGQNGLDLQYSTKLSKSSITNVIEHLSTTATGKSATLSKTAVNNAFTTDEWNALAATKSNWTISLV